MDINCKTNTTEYSLCEDYGLIASVINDEVLQLQHKMKRNWIT